MRVLYVNHTGLVSGGERSLLTLVEHLPAEVTPVVAAPPGPLSDALERLGVQVEHITGTDGSLKMHPLHTPRALLRMGAASAQVAAAARRVRADLLHANSVRAGLICAAAARAGAPPFVAHIRDCLPPSGVSSLTQRTIKRSAAVVIANSRHTASRFDASARVVYNPIDLELFDPGRRPPAEARTRLGLRDGEVVFTVAAQITPWKGQDMAVRALAAARRAEPRARLLLAGSTKFTSAATRHDNLAFLAELRSLIDELGVADAVEFLGEREDIVDVLAASDVLLAPSWEEPFGRSIVEAMALGVPVIATAVGGPAEIVDDGEDGLLLDPRDASAWEAAATRLASAPEERAAMGRRARTSAERFGVSEHVRGVLDAYTLALEGAAAA